MHEYRFAIDLGVPVVDMNVVLQNVVDQAGKNEEFSHSFFLKVRDMVQAQDEEALLKEKVHTKLLRLTAPASHGFVLTNFPNNSGQAEELESFKGGLNAFVHVSLPDDVLVDIEENKLTCHDCGRQYYKDDLINREEGIHIESFIPEDGHCIDCGSTNIHENSDPISFEEELLAYKNNKEDLLGFYDHYVSTL
jgi:adenylate kinase family enzyme